MKRILLSALVLLLADHSDAQTSDIRAELGLAQFAVPGEGPYLETYLLLKGQSLTKVMTEDGKYFSEVAIIVNLTKGTELAFSDAYRVKGPLLDSVQAADFIDQQRIPLKNGSYGLEMVIHDAHNPDAEPARVRQEVDIKHASRAVQLSDIQLVSSYSKTTDPNMLSKAGFDLVPATSNFFPKEIGELHFYFEVYNTSRKSGDEFLLNIFLEQAEDGRIAGDLRKYVKRKGEDVIPVLHSFPLKHIPSGNYNIVVEVRDNKNEVLDSKKFFIQRSNSVASAFVASDAYSQGEDGYSDLSSTFVAKYNRTEELEHHVRCLAPIANQMEISQINRHINFNDAAMMKRFLYNFWTKRYPDSAEKEWLAYKTEVDKVNEAYGTNLNMGYDTDRGRVYLMYGPPDAMSDSYFEPNTYPYEIWHYYRLENRGLNVPQNNKRFVFANMSLGTSEFRLIHSDADNEHYNARWHFELQKRNQPNTDLDQEQGVDHMGSRALRYYNNPR